LPELALIEGNQLVATKPDESLSPSLFTFRSHFAAIYHHWYYVFMMVLDLRCDECTCFSKIAR
jgi:hypothetical protein